MTSDLWRVHQENCVILRYSKENIINFTLGAVLTLVILASFCFLGPQYATALLPVAEITSVVSSYGQPVKDGAIIRADPGAFTQDLSFYYRGFDDNDHIVELRCSWDGINYLKSNCPQGGDDQEYRESFEGPDGVIRNYYYKSEAFTRFFQVGPISGSYIFGVKVLNDNNELSPPATFRFKIAGSPNVSPNVGTEQAPTVSKPEKYQVKVQLNSITVHNDHDGFWRGKGDFVNYAYVHGHRLVINTHVESGDTVNFKPDKQVTVPLQQGIPLSIFTVGNEEDCNVKLEPILPPQYLTELVQILNDPKGDRSKAVSDTQSDIFKKYLTCDGNKLGTIKKFHYLSNNDRSTNSIKSSNGDFTLRYTITVSSNQ